MIMKVECKHCNCNMDLSVEGENAKKLTTQGYTTFEGVKCGKCNKSNKVMLYMSVQNVVKQEV